MNPSDPILVTGGVRSGTTWIGRTLCQSPGIRYIHEPFNKAFPNPEAGFVCANWLLDAEHSPQREEIRRSLARLTRAGAVARAWRDATSPANLRTPLRLLRHLGRHLRVRQRVLVKDPLALVAAPWLARDFGFRVVVTIRRALPFVASMKAQGWTFDAREITGQAGLVSRVFPGLEAEIRDAVSRPGDLVDQAILLWRLTHHLIRDLQGAHPDWNFVRHEDLAREPQSGFAGLCGRLDIPFTPALAAFVAMSTRASEPGAAAVPGHHFRPRDASRTVNAWKDSLDSGEIDRVRAATHSLEALWYAGSDGEDSR